MLIFRDFALFKCWVCIIYNSNGVPKQFQFGAGACLWSVTQAKTPWACKGTYLMAPKLFLGSLSHRCPTCSHPTREGAFILRETTALESWGCSCTGGDGEELWLDLCRSYVWVFHPQCRCTQYFVHIEIYEMRGSVSWTKCLWTSESIWVRS